MRAERFRRLLELLPAAAALCLLVLQPERVSAAAQAGVKQCLTAVIPSLFPFFVLTRLLLSGGQSRRSGPVSRLFQKLFAVPASALRVFLLGLVSGFPVGASAAAELYRRGECTASEAERLLVFCNNCGPGFLFGIAAAHVSGGVRSAALLMIVQALSAVWLGALLGAGETVSDSKGQSNQSEPTSFVRAFTSAVQSGGRSALTVCAYVIFFTALTAFLPESPLLRGIFELTGGILLLPEGRGSLPAAAFLLGFGGLSVACQVLAVLDGSGLRGGQYLPGKLLQAAVMTVTVFLIQRFPLLLPPWALALIFLIYAEKGRKKRKNQVYCNERGERNAVSQEDRTRLRLLRLCFARRRGHRHLREKGRHAAVEKLPQLPV